MRARFHLGIDYVSSKKSCRNIRDLEILSLVTSLWLFATQFIFKETSSVGIKIDFEILENVELNDTKKRHYIETTRSNMYRMLYIRQCFELNRIK